MQDAALLWGQDLSAGNTGDVALVSGTLQGQQRVLRRLLTNPGDYIWQPSFGAGLGQFLGRPLKIADIRSVIRSQIFLEPCVARLPEPVIDVESPLDGTVFVQIRYVDSSFGFTQILSFSLGG